MRGSFAGQRPDPPFTEPWQARAFALAVVTIERLGLGWDAFREQLQRAIGDDPERPYFESWLAAYERLLTTQGIHPGEP
jgi:nitrile hydratase accessory protein